LVAQDCTLNTITLNSQTEVDNFQANNGPCDHVVTDLFIQGSDIQNLAGLSALTSIGGTLTIQLSNSLTNLNGLSSLTSVGNHLQILNNEQLTDIDGLSALNTVGQSVQISSNAKLASIGGLSGLQQVNYHLWITFNDSLTTIDGLDGVTEIGAELNIISNAALTDLEGLSSLVSIGQNLTVSFNSNLANVDGLASLKSVAGIASIANNPALHDVDGLSGLEFVGQDLGVSYNGSLADCTGLIRLIDQLDDGDPGPGPGSSGVPDVGNFVVLGGNQDGCNSISQILASAPLLQINSGLNDSWRNPDTRGQGFFITVFPNIRQIFLGWFSYDTERPAADVTAVLGEPGHRWLTAFGAYADNQAVLDIEVTQGGVFDSSTPAPTQTLDGTIILEFSSCNAGTVTYDIPSIGRQGVIPIERVALDNVARCYLLGTEAESNAVLTTD
jgi:hypothetical protein